MLWTLCVHVNICVGVTTSQPHTYQTPTELLGAQSVGSKKVPLALLVQSGLADRWWGDAMECICCLQTHRTKWQTESVTA